MYSRYFNAISEQENSEEAFSDPILVELKNKFESFLKKPSLSFSYTEEELLWSPVVDAYRKCEGNLASLYEYAFRNALPDVCEWCEKLLREQNIPLPEIDMNRELEHAARKSTFFEFLKWYYSRFPEAYKTHPFHLAVEQGNIEAAKYLISLGVDPRTRKEHAIRTAARKGDLDMVRFLMSPEGGSCDPRAQDLRALFEAVSYNRIDVVKYLCSKEGKCDPNPYAKDLLLLCFHFLFWDMAKVLLEIIPDDNPILVEIFEVGQRVKSGRGYPRPLLSQIRKAYLSVKKEGEPRVSLRSIVLHLLTGFARDELI